MSDTSGTRLLPANITLLQPGSRGYRLSDALTVASMSQQVANATTGTQIAQLQTDVTALQGYVTALQGQVTTLQGQVTTLQGQVSTLQTQVALFQAFQNSFSYLQAEVSTGTVFLDQRTIYKRSFVLNNVLDTALTNAVRPHGVVNINYIVNVQAMAAQAGGAQYPITFLNMATAPSMSTGVSCWADITNIVISVGTTAFVGFQALVTLWYTATDR